LVLCRFADGRIVSLELVITLREAAPSVLSSHPPPSCTGGVGRSVRCGRQAPPGRPHHVRQRCLLYCQAAPFRGRGEKCLQLQVSVTRPWCGPGGYIQVGMRGCESSGDPRAVRSVPPGSLLRGGDCNSTWGRRANHHIPFVGCCLLCVVCVVSRGPARGGGGAEPAHLGSLPAGWSVVYLDS